MPTNESPSVPEFPSSPAWPSEFNRHFQMVLTQYSPNQEGSIDKAYEEAKSHPAFAPHFPKAAAPASKEAATKLQGTCDTPAILKPRPSRSRATAGIDPTLLDTNATSDEVAMVVDNSLDCLQELPQLSQISPEPQLTASIVAFNPYLALIHPHNLCDFTIAPFRSPHDDGHIHSGPGQGNATQGVPNLPFTYGRDISWRAPQRGTPLPVSPGSSDSDSELVHVKRSPRPLKLSKHFQTLMKEFSNNGEAFAYIEHALAVFYRNRAAVKSAVDSDTFPCLWNCHVGARGKKAQTCTAILTSTTVMAHLKAHHGFKAKTKRCNWDNCRNEVITGELKRHLLKHDLSPSVPKSATVNGGRFGNTVFGSFRYKPGGRSDMSYRDVASSIRRVIAAANRGREIE
ncbi:hypothetical protein BKA70DRAFT_682915 [Coprinopsis sp. MPI-PUGE-AT-0042]|nr:hypothetical protein BKA70DRAFT_682915 [Coprinopsis sp. MPI-PUGE-AT-0042]